jgi:hypothetical protein
MRISASRQASPTTKLTRSPANRTSPAVNGRTHSSVARLDLTKSSVNVRVWGGSDWIPAIAG